ncbi:MAG: chorismate-binding protein, partial [Pseudomonadota bacterium]
GHSPDLIWQTNGREAFIKKNPRKALKRDFSDCEQVPFDPLESLEQLMEQAKIDLPDDMPAMAGGLIGYLGYDSIRMMEDIGALNPAPIGLPEGFFIRPTFSAVFDNLKSTIHLNAIIRNIHHPDMTREEIFELWQKNIEILELTKTKLQQPLPTQPIVKHHAGSLNFKSNMTKKAFMDKVDTAKAYIRQGDIFQVVLSQRFSAPYPGDPFNYYRSLRSLNPSPFLFFLDFGRFQLCGSSPEILVRVKQNKITIRPIAGTRPRGKDETRDKQNEQDLLQDPKELSEHLMLLDLGRNDAGRFAEIGSVEVDEQFIIERYSHVMHIVSNVSAKLHRDHSPLEALFAGFPAGTVSGAPK